LQLSLSLKTLSETRRGFFMEDEEEVLSVSDTSDSSEEYTVDHEEEAEISKTNHLCRPIKIGNRRTSMLS
jgi:hypothetical protein